MTWADIRANLGHNFLLPWWSPLAYVGFFMSGIIAILCAPKAPPIEGDNWDDDTAVVSEIDI